MIRSLSQMQNSVVAAGFADAGAFRSLELFCWVVLSFSVFFERVHADDSVPVSVPVKVLTPTPEPTVSMQPMMATAAVVKPTTPGGKLPQYQLGYSTRTGAHESDVSNPRLRILLALPDAPLLVEATITIDGKPYLVPREERVQELVKFSQNPEQHRKSKITLQEQISSVIEAMQKSAIEAATPKTDESVAEPTNEQQPAETETDVAPATPAESESPTVAEVSEYAAPTTLYDRVERYMAATEEQPTAEELRWLLTDWVDGPVVLLLNDNFQRFRADQRPVFKVLDRDRDQTISATEFEMAATSFRECDLNRDDLIDYAELAEVARDPRDQAIQAGHGKLTFLLPTPTTAGGTYKRLAHRYRTSDESELILPRFDGNSNGQFEPAELEHLQQRPADVSLSIQFNTRTPAKSTFEVTAISDELMGAAVRTNPADAGSSAHVEDPASILEGALPAKARLQESTRVTFGGSHSVTVQIAGATIDFSAVQRDNSDQISVGAVDDGYPMLAVLDPNDDQRFTIRELRTLHQRLTKFDSNHDNEITIDETRSTLRVCFGLGPLAHAELSTIRRNTALQETPTILGPDWFTRMDRNQDHDLTRKEFVGSDEQFAELDADADQLISTGEAQSFEVK